MKTKYKIVAYNLAGARWDLATGFGSRASADRALAALLARDGARAADSNGYMVPVTFRIEDIVG